MGSHMQHTSWLHICRLHMLQSEIGFEGVKRPCSCLSSIGTFLRTHCRIACVGSGKLLLIFPRRPLLGHGALIDNFRPALQTPGTEISFRGSDSISPWLQITHPKRSNPSHGTDNAPPSNRPCSRPLTRLCCLGNEDIVRLLVANRADMEARTDGGYGGHSFERFRVGSRVSG